MCPAEEAHERLRIAPNANLMETDPISGEPAAAWLVTMFHRNDAARVWKPSDIRTITALALSVEHLLCVVLPRRFPAYPAGPCPAEAAAWEASADSAAIGWEGVAGEPPFIRVASFVRDRLRQIRQELTMQQPSFSIEARQVAVDLALPGPFLDPSWNLPAGAAGRGGPDPSWTLPGPFLEPSCRRGRSRWTCSSSARASTSWSSTAAASSACATCRPTTPSSTRA